MTDHVLTEQAGGLGIAILDRPQALNALTLDMIRLLAAALARWTEDGAVRTIILRGNGPRAFCAGGDIKAAYRAGMAYRRGAADGMAPAIYFAEEYQLDRLLYHYRKPVVAFMDGIVMGGGFGIAGPCRYRIATENTKFAMPEVGIGFFPDVGSAYFLNGCPGGMGTYLALTGLTIGPADMLAAGLATHYVPAASLDDCAMALRETTDIDGVLERFSARPAAGSLAGERSVIDRCFAHDSIYEILRALEWTEGDFARATSRTIASRAPLSVKVTLEHLRRMRGMDFDTVIAQDFALVQHFLQAQDFYEGVRAAVIDKDRAPRWNPARLDDVTEADIARYFAPSARRLDEFAL